MNPVPSHLLPVQSIGRGVLSFARGAGAFSLFTAQVLAQIPRPGFPWRQLGVQLLRIGHFSLPVVALTSFFTGGALALQIYYSDPTFASGAVISRIVAIGVTRELGPVLTGLMVAGRVASAIAAETGAMRVTEQIDALSTLAANPLQYLCVPRLLAAVAAMPVLTLVADAVGILGGFAVSTQGFGFNPASYISSTLSFLDAFDILSGVFKSAVFGFIIALTGCFNGFNSQPGAQGVGRATTLAVVFSSILILAANYVLTSLTLSF